MKSPTKFSRGSFFFSPLLTRHSPLFLKEIHCAKISQFVFCAQLVHGTALARLIVHGVTSNERTRCTQYLGSRERRLRAAHDQTRSDDAYRFRVQSKACAVLGA